MRFQSIAAMREVKRIVAFGASNSSTSINKQLAAFAAGRLVDTEVELLDLIDYELPIYSVDLQMKDGIPENAKRFLQKIKDSDGIIISLAEHNGLHTAAFKNLWDWMSRVDNMNIWYRKPMFLLSTSPSRRAESNVMQVSKQLFPHFGAKIIADFHLPSFNHHYQGDQLVESQYKKKFDIELSKFQTFINQI